MASSPLPAFGDALLPFDSTYLITSKGLPLKYRTVGLDGTGIGTLYTSTRIPGLTGPAWVGTQRTELSRGLAGSWQTSAIDERRLQWCHWRLLLLRHKFTSTIDASIYTV